jgi:hypothetical protein
VMDDTGRSLTGLLTSDGRTSTQLGLLSVGMIHVQAAMNTPD